MKHPISIMMQKIATKDMEQTVKQLKGYINPNNKLRGDLFYYKEQKNASLEPPGKVRRSKGEVP